MGPGDMSRLVPDQTAGGIRSVHPFVERRDHGLSVRHLPLVTDPTSSFTMSVPTVLRLWCPTSCGRALDRSRPSTRRLRGAAEPRPVDGPVRLAFRGDSQPLPSSRHRAVCHAQFSRDVCDRAARRELRPQPVRIVQLGVLDRCCGRRRPDPQLAGSTTDRRVRHAEPPTNLDERTALVDDPGAVHLGRC